MRIFNSEKISGGSSILDRACRFLLIAVVLVMAVNVLLRFGFTTGSVKLQDLQFYLFAVFVPFSIVLAFKSDKHVRAGLIDKEKASRKRILMVDRIEIALGVFSFCVIFFYSLPGVISSWTVLEGSAEPEGLGGYFLVRTALPIICLLIIAYFCRKVILLRRSEK